MSNFEKLALVGKGAFGQIWQVRKKDTDMIYALKILEKRQLGKFCAMTNAVVERNILAHVHHPFIVNLHYSFQTKKQLFMVLDYVTGGDLAFNLLKETSFSEARVRFYAAELVLALDALHQKSYIYRDMKPDNVLLDSDGHIKLIDFGLSKYRKDSSPENGTFCGTPCYLAPEVIHGKPYGRPVDWWGLGTTMYELLLGTVPFTSYNIRRLYQDIMHGRWHFPQDCDLSSEARDIIKKLLKTRPSKRLGTLGAMEIQNHPFFKTIDWDKLLKKEIEPPFKPVVINGKLDTNNVNYKAIEKRRGKEGWQTRVGDMVAAGFGLNANVPKFTFVCGRRDKLKNMIEEQDEWECTVCGFTNQSCDTKCEVCELKQILLEKENRLKSDWKCKICNHLNKAGDSTCSNCDLTKKALNYAYNVR